ncbi:MAG TPA: hypothetical protein VFL36_18985 [Myxococcales bacterium]|nr:hypothetical protein [Myxococcales bacterium]
MVRPSSSLLGSSRAARRATLRAEAWRATVQVFRKIRHLLAKVLSLATDLVLLCALPFFYLAAAYLVLDLPLRWISHRSAPGGWPLALFAGAAIVCLTGISRAVQDVPPIAPVRPGFAKVMLGLSWVTALLLVLGDFA